MNLSLSIPLSIPFLLVSPLVPPSTHCIHPPRAVCSTTLCVHGIATYQGPLLVSAACDPGPLSLLIGRGHCLEPDLIPPLQTHKWLSPTRHIRISLLTSAICPPLRRALFRFPVSPVGLSSSCPQWKLAWKHSLVAPPYPISPPIPLPAFPSVASPINHWSPNPCLKIGLWGNSAKHWPFTCGTLYIRGHSLIRRTYQGSLPNNNDYIRDHSPIMMNISGVVPL